MVECRAQRETRERRKQVENDRDDKTEVNEHEQEEPTPRQGHPGKAPVLEGHALGLIRLSASPIGGPPNAPRLSFKNTFRLWYCVAQASHFQV